MRRLVIAFLTTAAVWQVCACGDNGSQLNTSVESPALAAPIRCPTGTFRKGNTCLPAPTPTPSPTPTPAPTPTPTPAPAPVVVSLSPATQTITAGQDAGFFIGETGGSGTYQAATISTSDGFQGFVQPGNSFGIHTSATDPAHTVTVTAKASTGETATAQFTELAAVAPAPAPVPTQTCWDGSIIPTADLCPVQPPPPTQTCADGSIIPAGDTCSTGPAPSPVPAPSPSPTLAPGIPSGWVAAPLADHGWAIIHGWNCCEGRIVRVEAAQTPDQLASYAWVNPYAAINPNWRIWSVHFTDDQARTWLDDDQPNHTWFFIDTDLEGIAPAVAPSPAG